MIPQGISRTVRIVVALAIAVCGGVPDTPWAVHTAQASSMPKPAGLQQQVDFWIAIFAKYSSHHVVVHDALHLDRVYTVLDFESLVKSGESEADIQRTRDQRAEAEKKRIRAILMRLHELGGQAQGLSLSLIHI